MPDQPTNKGNDQFYYPSANVIENSHIREYESLYQKSIEQREEFWSDEAEKLEWFTKWDKVLDDSKKPFYH
jgi:acetyl-CoA synthetase